MKPVERGPRKDVMVDLRVPMEDVIRWRAHAGERGLSKMIREAVDERLSQRRSRFRIWRRASRVFRPEPNSSTATK